MADICLSHAEKVFILHGIQDDIRNDGRSCKEYRSFELETGIVSNATGSARVRLSNTEILVGVKAELDTPDAGRPNEGKLEFFVDCSANAAPEFEGRGGDDIAVDISRTLTRTYTDRQTFDLKKLCIAPGQHCWVLYIDIVLLECGGNLYDACSIAVKSALYDTKIPNLQLNVSDGDKVDIELSDDPYDYTEINVEMCPLLITCTKVGKHHVIDSTLEEEACALCHVVIGVTESGHITCTKKIGSGSLLPDSLIDMYETAKDVGMSLNKALLAKLKEESKMTRTYKGFLR